MYDLTNQKKKRKKKTKTKNIVNNIVSLAYIFPDQ